MCRLIVKCCPGIGCRERVTEGNPGTEKLANVSLLAFGLKFLQVLVLARHKRRTTQTSTLNFDCFEEADTEFFLFAQATHIMLGHVGTTFAR